MKFAALLEKLQRHYGSLTFSEPTDPYELVLYTNCGYPPSQENCRKGFESLKTEIGLSTAAILAASDRSLAKALRAGGIVPELRASRVKLIARTVAEELGGNLLSRLGPSKEARKMLKRFPTIGDPGADKILLFCADVPIAAAPSNCLHVPLRLGLGTELPSWAASYRSVQQALAGALPNDPAQMRRAYLLLRHHGQMLCRRTAPACDQCPVLRGCAYVRSRSERSRPRQTR